jgi:hypothetical protein
MRRGFSVDRSARTRRGLRGLNRDGRPDSRALAPVDVRDGLLWSARYLTLDDHSDSMWLPTYRPADLDDEGRDDLVEIAYDGIVGVGS